VLWRLLQRQRQDSWSNVDARQGSVSLQIVLWTLWSLAVAGVGFVNWHADVIAQRPINTLGLVIHCVVAGVIGLVVMTVIEMRVEPWRFRDE
jgi:hypothetical protein